VDVAEGDGSEDEDVDVDATVDFQLLPRNSVLDVPQSAIVTDSSSKGGDIGEQPCVQSPARASPASAASHASPVHMGISEEAWNNAPNGPSMDLFPEGSAEYEEWNKILERSSHKSDAVSNVNADMTCVDKPDVAGMFPFPLF
jgi:hypothetical protein